MAAEVIKDKVNEGSSSRYTTTLLDHAGAVVAGTGLLTLKLTLYAKATPESFINSRNHQNVLNANNVTVDTGGVLTWLMQPADNAIVAGQRLETHIALFEATWTGGAANWEFRYQVVNLEQHPA